VIIYNTESNINNIGTTTKTTIILIGIQNGTGLHAVIQSLLVLNGCLL